MFDRRSDERVEASCFIISPETMPTLEKVRYWDDAALRGIERAEEMIAALKEYRTLLFQRAQQLESTPFKLVLKLERRVAYYANKKATHTVTLSRIYDGEIAEAEILRETFPGKQRHEAFKRFRELQAAHPGIETVQKI